MARSPHSEPDPSPAPDAPSPDSLAARLKVKYGDGVDPGVSLDGGPAPSSTSASDVLVRRLAEHTLRESRYQLEGELARGGMGAILRVWDGDLRRHLAMKVILGKGGAPASGGTPHVEPHQLARFLEEAQVTGQLDHPGIVPVHELGLDGDGRVYFTMKLVKGRDLKHVFDLVFAGKEGWNETRALSVILRACEGMAYAHSKGVIHRDLKPANVMVGNFGEVYVMDWGLARVLGRKDSHDIRLAPAFAESLSSVKTERREDRGELSDSPIVTMDGDVVGTPAYMPPEQARGEVERISPRSDVYAVGAMLYHLLARQAPYIPPGARLSARTVLSAVIQGAPTPLTTIRSEIPAELVAIVEKAMSREPERRYADTLALAEDLRAFLEHRVVGAYETGAWAEAKKWVQRNKPLAASLAGAVVLLIAGLTASLVFKARADRNAAETAEQAQIARVNEELAKSNEAAATRERKRADDQARIAQASEARATQKANDVLSLSAVQDLQDLFDRADALWPAHPENLAGYEAWLNDARELIEGRPGDAKLGIKSKPSLEQHKAKLLEIETLALPQSDEERTAERAAHPRAKELAEARARLQWMKRMLGEDLWPSESEIEAQLAVEKLPTDADGLNNVAWPLVDTDKPVYGSEVRGLLLARRAVAAAPEAQRHMLRDTLAWALFRTGRFEEALSEERRALAEAPEASKSEYAVYLEKVENAVRGWRAADGALPASRRAEVAGLSSAASELEQAVGVRRTWRFADGEARWWHVQLTKLVADLEALREAKTGLYSSGISEAHGWGVVRRAEFARSIEERSVVGAEALRRWDEAMAAIGSSPKYGGLKLTPQLGLLPIGADPASGLWEFAHLQTGDVAERGVDRKLVLTEGMGLVFVLIPGGTFAMGAQKTDPAGPNFDPQASSDESPVQEVALDAYFLSKYEMTQGQWERFVGRNPSNYGPWRYFKHWDRAGLGWSGLHPVEEVSWNDCQQRLAQLGLALPTEAQWENGARGESSTPWWTGATTASLQDAANVSDAYGKSHGNESWSVWEKDVDDGNTAHARIGSYRANAFGLHDVHGNLWEWCADGYGEPVRAGDGERQLTGSVNRVNRGGSFCDSASDARSAGRNNGTPEDRDQYLGLRPARASRLSPSPLHPSGK